MSSPRLEYHLQSPKMFNAFLNAQAVLQQSSLDRHLIHLVDLRISQINGCAYCLDMHTRDLLKVGDDFQRIACLPAWRETTFFTERERAALAWAEAVTQLGHGHVPDEVFHRLKEHFSDQQIADLGFACAMINAWNRLAIGFRTPVARAPLTLAEQ